MTRKKTRLIVLFGVLLAGCSAGPDLAKIRKAAQYVRTEDGVDRWEAVVLAQHFLVQRGLYDRLVSLEPYRVTDEVRWFKSGVEMIYVIAPADKTGITIESTWTLYFKDKRHSVFNMVPLVPFIVVVNANSGEIVNWGINKLGKEDERKRIN